MRKFYSNKTKKRPRERALFAAIGLGILALTGSAKEANAQENLRYEIIKIAIPDPNANFSKATHINEDSAVIGFYWKKDTPYPWRKTFFYKNGIIRDLAEVDYYDNPSINDLGDIVVPYSSLKSLVYKIGDKPIELDFFGEDINNKGEVVGGGSPAYNLYLYSEGKTIIILQFGDGIQAQAINEHTQVVGSWWGFIGSHAFLWENGPGKTDLPGGFSAALDINNKNQIVGYLISSYNPYTNFACLWEKDSLNKWAVRQLDTAVNSVAYAINDKGQIVGSVNQQATLYEIKDGELIKINLNDFLPESSEWERLVCALDINDKGQIVGYGEGRNEPGSQYAFLMTPKPQPSADLTGDGIVNLYDLAEFASQWLESNQQ